MLNRRFFKLNFVSCTSSLFGLGSFLDAIKHDFIRSESMKLARHDRSEHLDKHQTNDDQLLVQFPLD